MDEPYRQFVVFLKDAGTSRVTRHRVKARNCDMAARSFSDRGLLTLKAEQLWLHRTKKGAIVAAGLTLVVLAVYGSIEAVQTLSLYFG